MRRTHKRELRDMDQKAEKHILIDRTMVGLRALEGRADVEFSQAWDDRRRCATPGARR